LTFILFIDIINLYMAAELLIRADVPSLSWDEFRDTHPAGSIALDGYVGEGPQYDAGGPYYNANHHEDVNRLATLSSAQQVLMGVRMGLDKAFTREGEFAPTVYVNDCDQDICAAWYLLDNIGEARHPAPALNRFINVAGTLDVTAGVFPYDRDLRILGELAWVFEPYTDFRASGEINRKDDEQYRSVIQSVGMRIGQHLLGRGDTAKLDARYKVIGGSKDWKLIEEEGRDGRVGALVDGIDAYVTAKGDGEGVWRYTIGRRSDFIPFNVPGLLDHLNEVEGCTDDSWGGSNIIGGSPRVGGSKLSPAELETTINAYLERLSPIRS
jgi:hypothetical protein